MDLHSSIMIFVLFSILFLIFSIFFFLLLLSIEADLLMKTALLYYAGNSVILFVMSGCIFFMCLSLHLSAVNSI